MAHNDDSFWLDIFRKSPLIATFMAIGGLIGLGVGIYFLADERLLVSLRLILCLIFSSACGGVFIGLIIGVILDSLLGAARKKDKKKRKDDWRA